MQATDHPAGQHLDPLGGIAELLAQRVQRLVAPALMRTGPTATQPYPPNSDLVNTFS